MLYQLVAAIIQLALTAGLFGLFVVLHQLVAGVSCGAVAIDQAEDQAEAAVGGPEG